MVTGALTYRGLSTKLLHPVRNSTRATATQRRSRASRKSKRVYRTSLSLHLMICFGNLKSKKNTFGIGHFLPAEFPSSAQNPKLAKALWPGGWFLPYQRVNLFWAVPLFGAKLSIYVWKKSVA